MGWRDIAKSVAPGVYSVVHYKLHNGSWEKTSYRGLKTSHNPPQYAQFYTKTEITDDGPIWEPDQPASPSGEESISMWGDGPDMGNRR